MIFDQPRIIQASYAVIIPKQPDVGSKSAEFASLLQGQYTQLAALELPEDFPPEAPRVIYNSEHGFSQILVSQVTCSFQVRFSRDWQTDPARMRSYLAERIGKVYQMVERFLDVRPKFAGLSLVMNLQSSAPDAEIIETLRQRCASGVFSAGLHDFEVKIVRVVEERFFSNLLFKNYRAFPPPENQDSVLPMSRGKAIERGIQVTGDFNDRFSYNEIENYESPISLKEDLLALAFGEMDTAAKMIGGEK